MSQQASAVVQQLAEELAPLFSARAGVFENAENNATKSAARVKKFFMTYSKFMRVMCLNPGLEPGLNQQRPVE